MTPIEQIKGTLKLEQIIAQSFEVVGKGKVRTTKEHDSLVIWVDAQRWKWYSRDLGGDLFDWWQLQHRCDFPTALTELARLAGVELRPLSAQEQAAYEATKAQAAILRMAAAHYHAELWRHPEALDYVHGRGWNDETLKREQVGYVPSADNRSLSSEGPSLYKKLVDAKLADHAAAKAVLSIPQGYIVYVHEDGGQVGYLSGRSIEGKRHYNLPAHLVGQKPLYRNHPVGKSGGITVLCEGQADAISLGMMGLPAVALCGLEAGDVDVSECSHVALDNDAAGRRKAVELALQIDPLCRVVFWPEGIKDANDWINKGDPVPFPIEQALTALEHLAMAAKDAKGEKRAELLGQMFAAYNKLDELTQADLKPDVAKHLGVGVRQFDNLLKGHNKAEAEKKPDGPTKFEYSAGGAIGGYVWEQIISWDALGNGAPMFAVRNPQGKIEYKKTLDMGDIGYIPYPATLGVIKNRRIVLFPDKAEEYGSEQQIIEEIQAFIHHYLDTNFFYERLAAYYVLFSWLYDLFENLPYLRALGDYGTGKTRFIQTIGCLCYRPMMVSGAATASPVFRLINMFNGTLVMDEADFANSDAENELIKIVNVGYYKGGCVLRAEKEADTDIYAPETYDVYGPKILATRKVFADRAVESRCLTHRTTTARPRPGIPLLLNDDFWRRAQTLRNKLLMYRLRNHRPVLVDEALANDSVEPRLNQVTMALKSIINNDAMRQDIDTFISAYNETMINDRQMTLPALVLQALAVIQHDAKTDLMGNDLRDFTMKGITRQVQELLAEIDPETKVSPQRVSKILSEDLGLVKRRPHPENRRAMVVFEEAELATLMQRYGVVRP